MRSYLPIIGICLLPAGLALAQENSKPAVTTAKTLSSDNGRYVFGQISDYRRDQYVLDTKTGRLWQKVVAKVGKPGEESEMAVLQPILYEAPDGKWVIEPK